MIHNLLKYNYVKVAGHALLCPAAKKAAAASSVKIFFNTISRRISIIYPHRIIQLHFVKEYNTYA